MNRREFTKSLAAAAAAPALPLKALAAPAAAAPPNMVGWGALLARTHGQCSEAMLTRLMNLKGGEAARVMGQLIADGVVGPANAFGIHTALNPLGPNLMPGARSVPQAPEAVRIDAAGGDGSPARKRLTEALREEEPVAQEERDCAGDEGALDGLDEGAPDGLPDGEMRA